MDRLLALKIGNTETVLGLFEGAGLAGTWTVSSDSVSTPDEADMAVRAFLQARSLPHPSGAIACSVAPWRTAAWLECLRAFTGTRPLLVGPGLKSGIRLGYKDPGQMGGDRVACAVAARELFGAPAIVADFGTTTTLTVIGKDGVLLGGAIAPGMRPSVAAMGASAAQLAEVTLQAPRTVIGRTTADAMRTGIVLGEAARADGLVDAIWTELGYETALVATGRHAALVAPLAAHGFQIRDDLALQGLRLIAALNDE